MNVSVALQKLLKALLTFWQDITQLLWNTEHSGAIWICRLSIQQYFVKNSQWYNKSSKKSCSMPEFLNGNIFTEKVLFFFKEIYQLVVLLQNCELAVDNRAKKEILSTDTVILLQRHSCNTWKFISEWLTIRIKSAH